MTDILTATPGERRVVRLFRLDLPAEHIRFLQQEPGALADAIGVPALDPGHVEILKVADLEQLGLVTYLTEGAGVPETEIAADRTMLETLSGHVLVLFSRALQGWSGTLTPREGIVPAAAYGQPATDWTASPVTTPSAAPGRTPPREARAASRRIGGAVFAVVIAGVALLLWIVFR